MTLALDTSAVLAVAVDGPQRKIVLDALTGDPVWSGVRIDRALRELRG